MEWKQKISEKYLLPNHIEKIFLGYENDFSIFLRKMDKVCRIGQNPNVLICSKKEKGIFIHTGALPPSSNRQMNRI